MIPGWLAARPCRQPPERARASFTFSPGLQVSFLAQYDHLPESLGVKMDRAPGNDFFLVVNQRYDTGDDRFRPTAGDFSRKGVWTYWF